MGQARPSPAHGPFFFKSKTMGWAGLKNFVMGAHGPTEMEFISRCHELALKVDFLLRMFFFTGREFSAISIVKNRKRKQRKILNLFSEFMN